MQPCFGKSWMGFAETGLLYNNFESTTKEETSFDARFVKHEFWEYNKTKLIVEPIPTQVESNRRSPSTWVNNASITSGFIRGFTGHEHWDELGVIDMNGRMYDPVLGMFLSPDPLVQNSTSSQNFNRYAYCNNNPLKYTDPDGNCFFVPFLIGALIGVTTNGIINSINHRPFFEGALKQGLIGGFGAMAAYGIGNLADTWQLSGFGKVAFQTIAHGALGGTMTSLSGGKFEQGLLSGALGSLVATGAGKMFTGTGNWGQATGAVIGGSLSGGIGATIAGGNFWDGFRNGAISAGLNQVWHMLGSQNETGAQQPTEKAPWDINGDGKLQKNEADYWWLHGKGITINVDNSKIDWSGLEIPDGVQVGQIFSINTTEAFVKLPYETASTYGGTSFKLLGPVSVQVIDQRYHYDYRVNNSPENMARNMMNWIGKPTGKGADYMIHYYNPKIIIK